MKGDGRQEESSRFLSPARATITLTCPTGAVLMAHPCGDRWCRHYLRELCPSALPRYSLHAAIGLCVDKGSVMTRVITRRAARSFVLAALAIVAVSLASSSPRAAEAVSARDLRFCLKYSTNRPYASQPVALEWWDGTQWQKWRDGRSGVDGCGTFRDVVPNYYYRVQGHWARRTSDRFMTIWSGPTPWVLVGNSTGLYSTGWGTVSRKNVAW